MGRAIPVNWLPKTEIDWPAQSFRKSPWRQSADRGVASSAMPHRYYLDR